MSLVHEIAARRAADLSETVPAIGPAPPPRPLLPALARPGLHVIAEVKRRSPSAGALGAADDVVARARAYEAGGAVAISVLCEPHWFGGSVDDLRSVRAAVRVPVLAKDFVVDKDQLASLRGFGADVVLLLAVLHRARELRGLVAEARSLGLEPFVEAHDERELERALASDARLIGINNRDLGTLKVDPERAERLRSLVPDNRLVVPESGVSEPSTLVRWRALGFDAALIGEALMRSADPRASTAAFVAAGQVPADMSAEARSVEVKICGITDEAGVLAAATVGAEFIGLNVVAGTPRALETTRAAELARYARTLPNAPRVVLVTADAERELPQLIEAIDPDAVQLSGNESPDILRHLSRPAWKVVRDASDARLWHEAGCARIMLDAAHPSMLGGTGQLADRNIATEIASSLPIVLAGGLRPENVAEAVLGVPAIAVDVASGVEIPGTKPPRKDPLAVALFVKRAKAARSDRPHSGPHAVASPLTEADDRGRWGTARELGGRFVPETLVSALVELEHTYFELRSDPTFWAELRELGRTFGGRPTPIYRADRLALPLGLDVRLYLKREDLAHTGAHKINNVLGQGLLARRLG